MGGNNVDSNLETIETKEGITTAREDSRPRLGHRSAFGSFPVEPDPVSVDVNKDKEAYLNVFREKIKNSRASVERMCMNNKIHPKNFERFILDCLDNAIEHSPVVNGERHAWN